MNAYDTIHRALMYPSSSYAHRQAQYVIDSLREEGYVLVSKPVTTISSVGDNSDNSFGFNIESVCIKGMVDSAIIEIHHQLHPYMMQKANINVYKSLKRHMATRYSVEIGKQLGLFDEPEEKDVALMSPDEFFGDGNASDTPQS